MNELQTLSRSLSELTVIQEQHRQAAEVFAARHDTEVFYEYLASTNGPGLTSYQVKQIRKLKGVTPDEVRKSLFFGEYLLLGKLGEGGMGSVYKARHMQTNDTVALKCIKMDTPVLRKRLRTEFKAMQRVQEELSHLVFPPVVKALELFKSGKREILVMEYQNLGDLDKYVAQQEKVDWKKVAQWAANLLSGLHMAHEKNIIHRDIKPSNVMLHKTVDRTVARLADWGLAKVMDDQVDAATQMTKAGQILGSIYYMPPEQWHSVRSVVPASDLYTLGGTLFFALVGRPPFSRTQSEGGDSMHTLCTAHTTQAPPSVRAAGRPDVPLAMDELIRRMMAKRIPDRGTAGELREQFQALFKPNASTKSTVAPRPEPRVAPKPPTPTADVTSSRADSMMDQIRDPRLKVEPKRKPEPRPEPRTYLGSYGTSQSFVKLSTAPLTPEDIRIAAAYQVPVGSAVASLFKSLFRWLRAPAGSLGSAAKEDFLKSSFTLRFSLLAWIFTLGQPARYWYRWLLLTIPLSLFGWAMWKLFT